MDALQRFLGNRGAGERPMSGAQLSLFTVYLETMLACGMTLVPALQVLGSSGDPESSASARKLLREVEAGLRLSQALARQPQSFPSAYIRVIESAEASGRLSESLGRLSKLLHRQGETRRRILGALTYPAFLLVSSLAMVVVTLYLLFPMVISVTQDAGVDPPALTKLLIWLTRPRTLALLVGGVLATALLLHTAGRHERFGPALRGWFEQRTPPGRFLARVQVLHSVRQFAMMLESGVDVLKSLSSARLVGGASLLVGEAFLDIQATMRSGDALSSSFARHPVFPSSLGAMLSVAEYTGEAHPMLHRFCDLLEDDLNQQVETVTNLLEPILLGTMGIVIGAILVAAFLPIYQLVQL